MRQRNRQWPDTASCNRDAISKVGVRTINRFKWLVNEFAAKANSLDASFADEVAAFIVLQGGPGAVAQKFDRDPRITRSGLQKLAHQVQEGLSSVLNGDGWEIVSHGVLIRRIAGVPLAAQWRIRPPATLTVTAVRGLFLMCAQDLLMQQAHTLARCSLSDCQVMFVKDDPRQHFCSERHQVLNRVRRHRFERRSHVRA